MVEFSHPPDVAGDAARPPAEAEFQDARNVGEAHATWLATRREPLRPGLSGTSSSRGTGTENAAELHGRLRSEAAATVARTARPNAQGPGNTAHGYPFADRQIAEEPTAGDAMEMDEGQASDENATDMGLLGATYCCSSWAHLAAATGESTGRAAGV